MRTELFHRLLAVTPGKIQQINETPRKALAYLLSQETSWKLSDELASDFADATEQSSLVMEETDLHISEGLSTCQSSMTSADIPSSTF